MNNQSTALPNSQRPLSPTQAKQVQFLQTVTSDFQQRSDLLQLLQRVHNHVESFDPTELVNEMTEIWLRESGHDLNQKKSDIALLLNLLTFLSTIRKDFYCFEMSTDYPEWVQAWQEGGQDNE